MTIYNVKSILIALLAALTLYQTGVLWFVNITNRDFLLNYFPFMHQEAIPEGFESLVVPWRILRVHGDGRISARYNELANPANERYTDVVLSHLLQSGSFVGLHSDAQIPYFLSKPAYIYEYAFPMQAEWFSMGFGQRSNLLQNVPPFRKLIIQPTATYEAVAVFFICENGSAYEFTVVPPGRDRFDDFETGSNYIFADGQFIRDSHFYALESLNPYADPHGTLSLDFVLRRVSGFFNSPAAIRPIGGTDVWIYMDVNTMVRYYDNHILEYISYRAIDRGVVSSFLNDYVAAVQFIERDQLVVNEFYLSGFREEDGQRIFYFNYVVGDMPLVIPRSAPLEYPIEVRVDHGVVVLYRKLALNFRVNEEVRLASFEEFYRHMRYLLS